MKSHSQSFNQQTDQNNTGNQTSSHHFGNNSDRMRMLDGSSETSVADAFSLVAEGYLQAAKESAHKIAETGRRIQDSQMVQQAGKIWTIADSLGQIQELLNSKSTNGVKQLASTSADLTRMLMTKGTISQNDGERVVQSSGGYWNISDSAEKENSKSSENNSGTALDVARKSETIDQHQLSQSRGWAYCGIATSMMLLDANGKSDNNTISKQRDELISEIYLYGKGTDAKRMAEAMRKRGLTGSEGTYEGTFSQLISTLEAGQPVPFGISHLTGTIVKMNSNGSTQYPNKKVGDRHNGTYGKSGHWVLVVGYEGPKEAPTHFIINDPDLGGQVRATKSELEGMGVGNGQFYQVYQQ